MMLNKWIVLFLTTMLMLAACNSPVYNQTETNIADVKEQVNYARHRSNNAQNLHSSLKVRNGMYVDTTPINLDHEPTWLRNHIVLRGDQLPFSFYTKTIGEGTGNHVLAKYQHGLDATAPLTFSYSGTIKGALDSLATKTGYVYNIQGETIYWQAFVTKTFDVAFMPGGADYLLGNSANSSSGSTGQGVLNFASDSDQEFSTLKASLSIWNDIDKAVKQMLTPQGKMYVSEATTSVTVRDRPTAVSLVGQYINNLNHKLSKQVLVKVQVLSVSLQNDYDFGINWQLIAKMFHNSNFVLNGNYGTPVSLTALTPQVNASGASIPAPQIGSQGEVGKIPAWTILFNALNQQGKTSVVTEPRVVCLNNQVSVIRIVRQQGYVASIQNTALSSGSSSVNVGIGTVTSQVTPGNLITGLTLYILPKILKNKVFLQVNADLSKNQQFSTFGPTNSQIQLPDVTLKHFNQRSVIKSGDTLILAGFRELTNNAGANQFLESQMLGGKGSTQASTETIVLITPIILNGSA